MARGLFEEAYLSLPPWDIGRPQGEIIRLAVFLEWDALEIPGLGKRFDTIIDCGLFHVFSDEERPLYVKGLSMVLVPGGTLRMLCFSEMEPGDWGPRRVTQREIREAFDRGWRVNSIREARFETNLGTECCRAWLSLMTRE
jgi:cyclopropane fatty-acyl-phospholipid synthase-like methyltransferase